MNSAARPVTTPTSAPPTAGPREWSALAVLTLPVMLISVDMTVLGFAVPHLSEDLAPTGTQLLWIVDIYSFVLAGLLVTMGTLGDRIGRRRLLLLGSAGFGAASLLAALSPTAEILIAARALLGLAGATLMPSTISLIRNTFLDRRQRLLAIALWASMFSAGSALGPLVGGWLLERFYWGSVFLINLPVMALILLLIPLLVRESRDPAPGRYDLPSAALSLLAVLPVVYAVKRLAEGGSPVVAAAAAAFGAVAGYVFIRRQLRLPDPLIDVRLFRVRAFSVAVATNLMVVFAMVSALFFLTQYLQLVLGMSPLRAGMVLLPGAALSVAAHFVAVALARRVSMGTAIFAGLTLAAAGFAVFTQLPLSGGVLPVVVGFAAISAGVGLSDTLTNDAIMAAAPPERAGAAGAISETAYELGGALGVAVLGSVLTASYQARIAAPDGVAGPALDAARETLGGAVTAAQGLAPDTAAALVDAARVAFTGGIHLTSAIATVIVLYAAVQAGLLLRRVGGRPGRDSRTGDGAAGD
ncbi:MFS transporter [Marinactinospora rubrisoli]|uniref:MFS transporter n=1 Tax=Marinactinospora rubrisoli TaxID=2715399 RepID=A0ABW2KJX4_9ACTN